MDERTMFELLEMYDAKEALIQVLDMLIGDRYEAGYIADCIQTLPNTLASGNADQHNAQTDCGLRNIMVSTDPPYYDNINYAECADFFYTGNIRPRHRS